MIEYPIDHVHDVLTSRSREDRERALHDLFGRVVEDQRRDQVRLVLALEDLKSGDDLEVLLAVERRDQRLE